MKMRDEKWSFAFLLGFVFTVISVTVEGRIRRYRWEVKYELKSPDCYQKLAITINGKMPGPSIIAEQGDTIVVELKNNLLTENLAVHWHGIRQIGTPWSDGTEGVTQCPILPGETFVYKFVVDRVGTYIYHSHYGMQREAGLHGSIRVLPPVGVVEPFTYDYDRTLLLNDWWHKSAQEHAAGLSSLPFAWVNEPESLLINGRGKFNCSLLGSPANQNGVCNSTNPECSPYNLIVVPRKTYRLRIASITSLSALNLEIEGHIMKVVEADGHYVEPFDVKNLNIYSGETYSVLVTANQDPRRNYWIAINVISRLPKTSTGIAIFNYYPNHQQKLPPTEPPSGPRWNDSEHRIRQSLNIRARQGYNELPPQTSDKVITLLNTQNTINSYVRWSVNNVSFTKPHTPYLIAIKHKLLHVFDQNQGPEGYDAKNYDIYKLAENKNATYSNSIYRLAFNSTVDIILQNANTMKENDSETHPWHLHGHDFWVLFHGTGVFDPVNDPKRFNLVNPIMKNTVPVHRYGWTALRFRANNPGVWSFHCHIEAHFFLGMGIVFESGVDRIDKLPESIMGCGEAKGS